MKPGLTRFRQRGMALIVVLWLVVLLSVMAAPRRGRWQMQEYAKPFSGYSAMVRRRRSTGLFSKFSSLATRCPLVFVTRAAWSI